MTTIVISTAEREDSSDESVALDRFKGIGALLPKLAQPFWYRQAHSGRWVPEKERQAAADIAVERVKRREQRKKSRLARALAGEHTRVRAVSA